MKQDSVNFTDDLIKGYCDREDLSVELLEKMYSFYLDKIKDKLTDSEAIEVPINGLGVFFLPMHGAIIDSCAKEKAYFKGLVEEDETNFFLERKDAVANKIKKCKDCGVKNIRFLHTLIERDFVKNT